MQYRENTTLQGKPYNIVVGTNAFFPGHLHYVYEFLYVKKGFAVAQIEDQTYTLQVGEGLIVFPLQYHSYKVDEHSEIEILVFSSYFIAEFEDFVAGKRPTCPKIAMDFLPALKERETDILYVKACAYFMCHKLLKQTTLIDSNVEGCSLSVLDHILLFVDNNYHNSCNLYTVSEHLKYDYTYLSKLFKEKTGMTYNQYLNQYRINKSSYLLINQNLDIADIAYQVGYNSIRTFNWEFRKIKGTTPAAFRRGLLE